MKTTGGQERKGIKMKRRVRVKKNQVLSVLASPSGPSEEEACKYLFATAGG